MKAGVYLLNEQHRLEIEELRKKNLVVAEGFVAQEGALLWNDTDQKSIVLGVRNNQGVIISTMRVEIITQAEDLKQKLDYDGFEEVVGLPCGLLGKAATDPLVRGQGLNSYLRYIAFQYFIALRIRHVVGTIIPGAPRQRLMEQLGYQFYDNPQGWRRYGYKSHGNTLVATLDLLRAADKIETVLGSGIENLKIEYPMEFTFEDILAHPVRSISHNQRNRDQMGNAV